MEIMLCRCNHGIPGVESLPAHHHVYSHEMRESGRFFDRGPFKGQPIMQMVPDPDKIFIHVDWKEVARALAKTETL